MHLKRWCVMSYPIEGDPVVFERFTFKLNAQRCLRDLMAISISHIKLPVMKDGKATGIYRPLVDYQIEAYNG